MTRDELRLNVALMRELGVLEWNGIKLGQAPGPPTREPTKDEIQAKIKEERLRRRDVAFAASSVRPVVLSEDP